MIKLYNIIGDEPIYQKHSDTHWKLIRDWAVKFYTTEGVIEMKLKEGWITDFRSGSSVCDMIVPKKGNFMYTATVCLHDMCYSGHLSKDLADELLYQGMVLSGQSKWRAKIAYAAVQLAGNGAYYNMDMPLPSPYTNNRSLENLTWSHKLSLHNDLHDNVRILQTVAVLCPLLLSWCALYHPEHQH